MEDEGESAIVAKFAKNNREVICVGISEYKGKTYVFVRLYVPDLNGELTPTQEGINLGVEKSKELIQGVKALGEVMSSEKVVARIQKNDVQQVWIGTNLYKELPLIFLRTFVAFGGEDYKPTKKGVSMKVDLIPKLIESIEKLEEQVELIENTGKN